MQKREAALKLDLSDLRRMDIGTLQAVAQALGVAPRQERSTLIRAILREIIRSI